MAVFKKLVRSASGAKVPHNKNTENIETVKMPVPARVHIAMSQHIGAPAKVVVKKGDEVKVGTVIGEATGVISACIHSSVSGKVFAVEETLFPNGQKTQTVVIDTDGEQTVCESVKAPEVTDYTSFIEAVKASGLVGLGGAGFPTNVKLAPKNLNEIDTLIINAAECEPYITADYREIIENGADVIEGTKLVKNYLNIAKVIIGIEKNKPAAISKMKELCRGLDGFTVLELPSVYPQGAEKVIIETATGREIPEGALPSSVGCIVMNVSSVGFVARYMKTGMPLTTKRITVDGDAINEPKNVEVVIGTTIKDVIEFCGGYKTEAGKIILGGPMMGTAVISDEMPIIKQNNAITVFSKEKSVLAPVNACIRCGRCVSACPIGLSPVEIALALAGKDEDELKDLSVNLCMDCGSCSFVCPAKRPVSQTMKEAKDFLRKAAK